MGTARILLFGLLLASGAARADEFSAWAKQALIPLARMTPGPPWQDLEPLGKMIGGASIVALSEATHGAAEPLEFRNRMFQYLVEREGFTAIAIESGSVEGRKVYDYVRGGPGSLEHVVSEGISWGFNRFPQNRALIVWIRAYNADGHHARKVNFYGFDVPGSPGNANARRGVDTALLETLGYLDTVDAARATIFRARVHRLLPHLRFNLERGTHPSGYERLSASERDVMSGAIADLIALLERRKAAYIAASSPDDYRWAYRAAIGARQVDNWLRCLPLDWQPSSGPTQFPSEQTRFLAVATDIRDQAQADTMEWIMHEEGAAGRVLVYAHRYHLSAAPVRVGYWVPVEADRTAHEVSGVYLRHRFEGRLFIIGNLIRAGEVGCAASRRPLAPSSPTSIEARMADFAVPRFLLDLHHAPAGAAPWLEEYRELAAGNDKLQVPIGKAFDALFYIDTVTPACAGG